MKQGDILIKGDDKIKVLGVCGEVIFVSDINNFNYIKEDVFTEQGIHDDGWKLKEEWIPERNERYWFIEDREADWNKWDNDEVDNERKNFLGIFKTHAEAQARLDKIKEFIKSL